MAGFSMSMGKARERMQELSGLNRRFWAEVGTLTETEQALNGMWEGASRTDFHARYLRDRKVMEDFHTAIDRYVQVLQNIIEAYEKAEHRNMQIASGR